MDPLSEILKRALTSRLIKEQEEEVESTTAAKPTPGRKWQEKGNAVPQTMIPDVPCVGIPE